MNESALQSQCFLWFHNNFPALRGLLCYNLNNSKNAIDGNRNRSLGLQKGRSDMTLFYAGKTYHIEFKTETGRQSPEQKKWQELVESHGFEYIIIRTLEEFKQLIINIHSEILS
jgi:hypothetical protein